MLSRSALTRYASLTLVGLLHLPACGGGGGGGGGVPGPVPLTFGNFQPAAVVFGQADFSGQAANAGGAPSGDTCWSGFGASAEGSWWLPDGANNRVLGFTDIPFTNGAAAVLALGQPNLGATGASTTATGLSTPGGLSVEGGRLAVADLFNNRVLIWNTLPATNGAAADVVVGQPNFTSGAAATTQTGMQFPLGAFLADGRLFVLDGANHRVLIYNSVPATNGAAADVVVGQPDFTTGTTGPLATGMHDPSGIWSDGVRLVVADSQHRVLIWNSIPTVNNTPADIVVGQPNLTTSVAGAGPQGLNFPQGVWSNGLQLFVADTDNNRVLIYTPFPTTDHAAATTVLGQGDSAHVTENDDDQNGVQDATPSEHTLDGPAGIALFGNRLIVTDRDNNRVLIYEGN